jgi:hypothetical protein
MILPLSLRAASSTLKPVALMRLTEVKDVDELLKHHKRDDIVIEKKLDGWKAQAIKEGGKVRLFSRRGEEKTGNFPDIVKALAAAMPDGTLIEGELVYWHKGKQDVTKVQSVAGSSADKAREKASALPGKFKFHLYDILWLKGKDVSGRPFSERRKLLESSIKTSESVQMTKTYPFASWQKVMNEAVAEGGEGIVLKLKDKKYHWKPGGEREPKPADVMFKYKGGVGKSDSDDYVVYDYEMTDKGKMKALFGQNYKGRLYHISDIDNFSSADEAEIKKRLGKGPFVIEIGFQERVPKGLRHQKFIRFRDDKKPKDATMNEFHAKHVSNFEPARKRKTAMLAIADFIPSGSQLVKYLKDLVRTFGQPSGRASGLSEVSGVDIGKAYQIVAKHESKNRYAIGDAGTSFGTVQLRIDSMLYGLAADPHVRRVSGMPPDELRQMAAAWNAALRAVSSLIRSGRLWKTVPVDEAAVREAMKQRGRVLERMEGTKIRYFPNGQPGFVRIDRNGRMEGHVLNMDAIESIPGFRMTPEARARIEWIMRQFVTGAVVKNALAKVVAEQEMPQQFAHFERVFKPSRVNRTPALRALVDRVAQRNFSRRVQRVVDAVKAAGYDTSAPGAFNIYQLISMANTGGVGAIQRFLGLNHKNEPRFKPQRLPRGVMHALRQRNPTIEQITGIKSSFPPGGGMAGFTKERSASDPALETARGYGPRGLGSPQQQARRVAALIEKWLNFEHINSEDMADADMAYIGIVREMDPPAIIAWVRHDADAIQALMPDRIFGMRIDIQSAPDMSAYQEFAREKAPTKIEPFARMSSHLFGKFKHRLQRAHAAAIESAYAEAKKELGVGSDEEAKARHDELMSKAQEILAGMSELDLRRGVLEEIMREENLPWREIERILGTKRPGFDFPEDTMLLSSRSPGFSKRSFLESGALAFPGQYAQDIREGKREYTIRPTDMPVEPDQVVTAVTYSGSPICRIRIISKETMSLGRIRKAFGDRIANSLEKRFGPGRRLTIIRFQKFDVRDADDGEDGEDGKWKEVLIDKDGIKLTRGQIRDHYSKPAVRKRIMSRIKGKPVLVYIGTGTNQKILKRNHDGKPIVITSDDPSGSENPSNYWYWVKRRLLSIHEVLGSKVDHGFVDLDLHGGYPLEKARQYAAELAPKIAAKFGKPEIYQSGGSGLHIEFKLKSPMSVDALRKELRDMLDEFNQDHEGVTTGLVKGKGMRSDVSTLHNKGGIRVPDAIGETWGRIKKKLSGGDDENDDDYGNNAYGVKHDYEGEPLEGGAITARPPTSVAPGQPAVWHASLDRKELFRRAGEGG